MPKPLLTPELAIAAGQDAANRRMRSEGRTIWDEGDSALATEVSARLLLDIPIEAGGLKGIEETVLRLAYPTLFKNPGPS